MAPEGVEEPPSALVPFEGTEQAREAPPRVLKPSALNDQCVAPTPDLESHRKRLREAFGNTLSDEFVEVLLGKLVEALRPAALELLEESTVNAALAIMNKVLIDQTVHTLGLNRCDGEARERRHRAALAGLIGIGPQDEMEGMIAAQLIATHNAAMECYRRAMIAEQTLEGRRENLNQANKLVGGGGTKPPIGSPSSKGPSIGGLFGGVTSPIVKQTHLDRDGERSSAGGHGPRSSMASNPPSSSGGVGSGRGRLLSLLAPEPSA